MTMGFPRGGSHRGAARDRWEKDYRYRKMMEKNAGVPPVQCECGCGTQIPAISYNGTPRRFAEMHHLAHGRKQGAELKNKENRKPPQFRENAACAGCPDPEIFFPPLGRKEGAVAGYAFSPEELKERARRRLEDVKAARTLCLSCPVRAACLDWAVEHNERDGIWGGLLPSARRGMKKARATA